MTIGNNQIQVISVGANGITQGNADSGGKALSISRDGNTVVFFSYASNLFSPDPYGTDFVVKNLQTQSISAITIGANNNVANGTSGGVWGDYGELNVTPDGKFAVFGSTSNLMPSGIDGAGEDIFERNLHTGELIIASIAQGGVNSYHSMSPDVSDNGRYIVFTSMDNLLRSPDANAAGDTDIYWLDTVSGELKMVSGAYDGSVQGNSGGYDADSANAHVTNNGRYVIFESAAKNFSDVTGGYSQQIFVRDMLQDNIFMISSTPTGVPGNGTSEDAQITPNGQYAIFTSQAGNLVNGDIGGSDVFRIDLFSGEILIVNRSLSGQQFSGASHAQITPDGRYVVFESDNGGLVSGGTGGHTQVFVKDMLSGNIAMVSVDEAGRAGENNSEAPHISDDGQYIVFSTSSALVSGDVNGYSDVYRVLNPIYASGTDLNNDVFSDSPEKESFNGELGIDKLVYSGEVSDYYITIDRAAHTATVTNRALGPEAMDNLANFEKFQFGSESFDLFNPVRTEVPMFNTNGTFLFDAAYYLLSHPELAGSLTLSTADDHYLSTGAALGYKPNSWFDPTYYENRWADLKNAHLDDATLFLHYNLYGVWEGRSAGPAFDHYDGARYLRDNPDVAAYVDANVADFLGSRTNGAIAHYVIYGANEGRIAYDISGQEIESTILIGIAP